VVKVAIGVCGIGYGHSSRQLEIARRLVAMGHEVRILTFDRGLKLFGTTEFRDRCIEIHVPWIECDHRGFRRWKTVRMNWRDYPAGVVTNRRAEAELRTQGFRPDVCVADYEPVVARLAGRVGAPLVTVDQQSKFLGFQIAPVGDMTREEERSRLARFFPRATKRLATSFYDIQAPPDPRFHVDLVPPIIRREVAALAQAGRTIDERLVLVYLSGYPQKGSVVDVPALARVLGRLSAWRFRIYSQQATAVTEVAPNVQIRPTLTDDFRQDLGRAAALICTAGHTLLSEAMALEIPVLTTPLFTYDQHLCARVISDADVGIGMPAEGDIPEDTVVDFLGRLDSFRRRIAATTKLLRAPVDDVLDTICREIVGLT
jgi:uncharacterized protein (TIGR00661 family)